MSQKATRSRRKARPLFFRGSGPGVRRFSDPGPPAPLPADPVDLEDLERRLESALAGGPALDPLEPCVWFCACFLVHGP